GASVIDDLDHSVLGHDLDDDSGGPLTLSVASRRHSGEAFSWRSMRADGSRRSRATAPESNPGNGGHFRPDPWRPVVAGPIRREPATPPPCLVCDLRHRAAGATGVGCQS